MNDNDARSGVCVFSIDVEDWFHILDAPATPAIEDWDLLPSRVERNLLHLLDVLDEYGVLSTCFFLGWVAKRFPALVKEASRRGHELASHGYAHKLVHKMTRSEFVADASSSRKVLEDISGKRVWGFRAPGFSATAATPWFFDALLEAGFRYDTSVFPARHGHGGMPDSTCVPHWRGGLLEFPITVVDICGYRLCCFGGGYLRLTPKRIIRKCASRVLAEKRPVIFYIHPREIDPAQLRLPLSAFRRFRSYVNVQSTEEKVKDIFTHFRFVRFLQLAQDYTEQRLFSAEMYSQQKAAASA